MKITMNQTSSPEKRPVWTWSAREIAAQVRSGQMTATAVIDAHLERINFVNPSVHALTVVFTEQSRALAQEIDRRISQGDSVGALAGVPFSVKENLDLTWSATTDGWSHLSNAVPSTNATVVQRMLDAGAIPIGRGNMPPKGLRWDTDNELFGRTYNPWARDRVAGGSSGGDAVAIATGMVSFGLGNDYGGSLRLPAYAGGVCALRPSAGRVPIGMPPGEPVAMTGQLFAVNGPIARTIDDLDTAFALMNGADGIDPLALTIPHPDHYEGLRAAAVVRNPLGWGVDREVAHAIDQAADALVNAGWEIEDIEPPFLEEAANLWRELSVTELAGLFAPGVLPAPMDTDATAYVVDNASETKLLDSVEAYSNGWGRRYLVAAAWEKFQSRHPVILGPVSARRMPRIGYDLSGPEATTQLWRDHRLLVSVNLLGLPSVALPTGLDADGIPSGVQLIGPRNGEHVALAAARDVFAALGSPAPVDPRQ